MMDDLFETATPQVPRVFSVSEITRAVRVCLENEVGEVWVQGEICNHRKQSSGHQYFGLKDGRALLGCVLFQKNSLRMLPLADGMLVQVRGDVTVYEARGQYQLVVNLVQAAGVGLLQAKFDALKRKLEAEGLFAAERKKPLPKFPRVVGIVTSPSGAAIHDMLNVIKRRASWVHVVLNPVRVQGSGAAKEMAAAVREFNEDATLPRVDVIVVCRGGGSAEDLWEFNEEIFGRAIAASKIPVVSAVGHEIDFTISDFVADLRAPTPSAAGELIVPETMELTRRLAQFSDRMNRIANFSLSTRRSQVREISRCPVFRKTEQQLDEWTQRVDLTEESMRHAARGFFIARRLELGAILSRLREHRPDQIARMKRQQLAGIGNRIVRLMNDQRERCRNRVSRIHKVLMVLSPGATLQRGYSITTKANGELLRSAAEIKPRMKLITRLGDGTAISIAQ